MKIGYSAVGPYRIPNVAVESRCVYTNLPPNGAFRGFGATQAAWASERALDVLADRLGHRSARAPAAATCCATATRFCTGETMHDVHFAECLERAADAIGWHEDRRGKGLVRAAQGHADAEPGVDRGRGGRGRRVHAALRDGRARPGLAPGAVPRGGRAARRPGGRDPLPRPGHRPRSLRHAGDVEPLDVHDERRARGGRARSTPRRSARRRGVRERRRARPGHRPGHRLLALAPGRSRRRGARRRGDRPRRGGARSTPPCTPGGWSTGPARSSRTRAR